MTRQASITTYDEFLAFRARRQQWRQPLTEGPDPLPVDPTAATVDRPSTDDASPGPVIPDVPSPAAPWQPGSPNTGPRAAVV